MNHGVRHSLEWKGTVDEFDADAETIVSQIYEKAKKEAATLDEFAKKPRSRFSIFDTIDPYQF